jgi:hypothetical protein
MKTFGDLINVASKLFLVDVFFAIVRLLTISDLCCWTMSSGKVAALYL